jgi:hypothetical protein
MTAHLTPTQVTAARLHAINGGLPVRVAAALEAGLTRGALRAAVASGDVLRVRHGVVSVARAHGGERTLLERCHDLAQRRPSIIFSHVTAAELQHLPRLRAATDVIHAYGEHAARTGDLLVHEGRIPEEHIVEVHGLRMTSPLRTALDLSRGLALPEALIPLDAALRGAVINAVARPDLPDDIAVESQDEQVQVRGDAENIVASMRHLHGVRQAERALAVASPLAESPAESASRGHLHLARIEPIALQARVIDSEGVERRLDFLLAPGLAGEVDGFVKYEGDEGRQAARKEKRRDLALQREGMFTVRWSAEEAFWRPRRVIQIVRHAVITRSAIA